MFPVLLFKFSHLKIGIGFMLNPFYTFGLKNKKIKKNRCNLFAKK
jgi:hypothetical protein